MLTKSFEETMEPSSPQPLATDSFSYSWLTNRRPSFDGLLDYLRTSFDSSDESTLTQSFHHHHHRSKTHDQDFDFHVVLPESKPSDSLIHADDIFFDGCIRPVYPAVISLPTTPVASFTSVTKSLDEKNVKSPCGLFQRVVKESLKKSLSFFSKLGCSRDGVRVDDLDRKVKEISSQSNSRQASPEKRREEKGRLGCDNDVYWGEIRRKSKKVEAYKRLRSVKSCSNSPFGSPPRSSPLSMDPWRHVECSIDEAILHCKRSFASIPSDVNAFSFGD